MGRPRKLTAEQENEIWRLFTEGVKPSKIAKQMDLPYMIVYNSVRRETDGPTRQYCPGDVNVNNDGQSPAGTDTQG